MIGKKAQAATEYLSTYGWAVLILALVLAALWVMGVFDVKPPEGCNFPGGTFACGNYKIVKYDELVEIRYLKLTNTFNKEVYICGFVCTKQAPNPNTGFPDGTPFQYFPFFDFTKACAPGSATPSFIEMTLGPSETKRLIWGQYEIYPWRVVNECYDASGNIDTNGNVGDAYSNTLYVFYSFEGDTSGAARMTVGHISTTIQKWGGESEPE